MSQTPDAESGLHEHSTISLRGMIVFLVCFTIAAMVIHAAVYGLFKSLRHNANAENVPMTGLNNASSIPPEPRLQPSPGHERLPIADLAELRARERAEFQRRGWIDHQSGQVRIPPDIVAEITRLSAPPTTRSSP